MAAACIIEWNSKTKFLAFVLWLKFIVQKPTFRTDLLNKFVASTVLIFIELCLACRFKFMFKS